MCIVEEIDLRVLFEVSCHLVLNAVFGDAKFLYNVKLDADNVRKVTAYLVSVEVAVLVEVVDYSLIEFRILRVILERILHKHQVGVDVILELDSAVHIDIGLGQFAVLYSCEVADKVVLGLFLCEVETC